MTVVQKKRKPDWLIKKININELTAMKRMLGASQLNTICEEALCPNISECFHRSQASFLILGAICTRACTFCNVSKGVPLQPDMDAIGRLADAIRSLKLRHVVITSPTRDDLPDGGASYFAMTVRAVRERNPHTAIEILVPDFNGSPESIETIVKSNPDIIGHNLETVERLYDVRRGADYRRSLDLLSHIRNISPAMKTKSGVMLGLGETNEELVKLFGDLLENGCSYLSIGQYLQPSKSNHDVDEYCTPERFEYLGNIAREMGFLHVESAPFVRSSYHAGDYMRKDAVLNKD